MPTHGVGHVREVVDGRDADAQDLGHAGLALRGLRPHVASRQVLEREVEQRLHRRVVPVAAAQLHLAEAVRVGLVEDDGEQPVVQLVHVDGRGAVRKRGVAEHPLRRRVEAESVDPGAEGWRVRDNQCQEGQRVDDLDPRDVGHRNIVDVVNAIEGCQRSAQHNVLLDRNLAGQVEGDVGLHHGDAPGVDGVHCEHLQRGLPQPDPGLGGPVGDGVAHNRRRVEVVLQAHEHPVERAVVREERVAGHEGRRVEVPLVAPLLLDRHALIPDEAEGIVAPLRAMMYEVVVLVQGVIAI
mmetsp:Transcript_66912/g.172278  ORF Transcript_66912/g.172278 Transcript_66912/m.172278 type:complete len:296 (+) Transcript_66912:2434-3321(+)